MNWMHCAEAVVAAVIACSFTDWFFMGVLFHGKYKAHPEVWRDAVTQGGESRAIAWATLLTVVTCAAFVALCAAFAIATLPRACALAIGIWLVAPLPMLVTNAFFIKFHPLVTVSQALGWLAKLLVCAFAAAWLL
jgi:hypothetical protein